MIEAPAHAHDVHYAPHLVDRILTDTSTSEGALPRYELAHEALIGSWQRLHRATEQTASSCAGEPVWSNGTSSATVSRPRPGWPKAPTGVHNGMAFPPVWCDLVVCSQDEPGH